MDWILRHARFLHLGLAHRQGQETGLAEEREDECAVPGDHAKRRVPAVLAAGDEHCLIG